MIEFNYAAVDRVTFTLSIHSGSFVVDDVLLDAAEPKQVVDAGHVRAETLGHSFFVPHPLPPAPSAIPNTVGDLLVDQDQSSGGGAVVSSVSADFESAMTA